MKNLTALAYEWALRCFGENHVANLPLRALRIAEECVEFAQACDVPKEKMMQLIDVVYSRPKGTPKQELGGIMMTTAVVCARFNSDPETILLAELQRCLAKPVDEFKKRNEEKLKLGLDF